MIACSLERDAFDKRELHLGELDEVFGVYEKQEEARLAGQVFMQNVRRAGATDPQ